MTQSEQDDKDLESLFNLVGFVVVQWGQAEQSLDLIVAMLYQDFGGNKFVKRLPKMLSTKISFIRKCLEEIPELAIFQNPIDDVITEFERLSSIRHDFIHGAIADTVPENGAFKFVKLDFEKEIHVLRDFSVNGSHVPKLRAELIKLGADTINVAKSIWAHYEHKP